MTEDNDVKSETDCMDQVRTEKKEKEKKGDKEKHTFHLDIDIEKLLSIPLYKPPENQIIWKTQEEMSAEYMDLNDKLQLLTLYIARQINEGPEVKDNVGKRLVLARGILGTFIDNLSITGYDAYGMLLEMLMDTFMRVSGRRYILGVLNKVAELQEKMARKQSENYTS